MNNIYINLPKIDENLDVEKRNHREKYKQIYIRLITKCRLMSEEELSGYNEKHHIIPKCLGGDNSKENIILLPVRYHIMSHLLLHEIYPENNKLTYSLILMASSGKSNALKMRYESSKKHLSSRTLARIREDARNSKLGKNNPMFGKKRHLSEEHIEKLKKSNRKQVFGPNNSVYESIKSAAESYNMSVSTIRNWIKDPNNKEWKIIDNRISRNIKSGGDSIFAKKIIGPDGTIYNTLSEASKHFNGATSSLINRLKGRLKDGRDDGWRYLDPSNKSYYSSKKKRDNIKIRGNSIHAKKVIGPDNTIYDCIQDALDFLGISRHTLLNWIKSGNKGWKYFD